MASRAGESVTGTARTRGQSVGRLVARFEGFQQGQAGLETRTAALSHPLAAVFARWWRACQPSAQCRLSPDRLPHRGRPEAGRHMSSLETAPTFEGRRASSQGTRVLRSELRRGPSPKPSPAPEDEKLDHSTASPCEASGSLTSTGTSPSAGVAASGSSDADAAKVSHCLVTSARAFLAARGVPCRKVKTAEPSAGSYRLDSDTEGSDQELGEWRRGAKDVLAAAKLLVREVRLAESWSAGSARKLPDFFAADVADELWARPPGSAGRFSSSASAEERPTTAWLSCAEEPSAPSLDEVLAELEGERRARRDCAAELRDVEEQKELLRAEVEQLSHGVDVLRAELQVANVQIPELCRDRQDLLQALQEMRETTNPDTELQLALASTTAAVHELRQRLSNAEAAKRQLQQRCEKLEARDQEMQPELQKAQQLHLLLQEEQQLRQNLEEELMALRAARGGELPEAVLSAADLAHHMKQRPEGAAPVLQSGFTGPRQFKAAMAPEPMNGPLVRRDPIPICSRAGRRERQRLGRVAELLKDEARVGHAAKEAGASHVTLTDRGAVVSQLRREVADDRSMTVEELTWGAELGGTYDVILASDVLYNTKSGYRPLVHTICSSLKPDGILLICCRWRKPIAERRFFRLMEATGFAIELLQPRSLEHRFAAPLSWKDFGNPRSQASNRFLTGKIPVGGVLTKISEITEELQERLSDEEHVTFEGNES
ncbi:unnamed protein product [Symbiodinium sp. CCMP2592]|nr:unnamed protein product [Symbiodinium sp. CCMP2592]